MKVSYYEVKQLPVIIIDDYYDKSACDKIWQELCFLNNDDGKFKGPAETGSATTTVDGKQILLKDNRAIGLDIVYLDRSMSSILKENRKVFSKEMLELLESHHTFFRYVHHANKDSTLVNYYENAHYYKSHMDDSTVTSLSFFYQQPRSFAGGELIIENELKIDCIYNRFVIFPSMLKHSVEEISMQDSLIGKNYGRYSITQLMSINI